MEAVEWNTISVPPLHEPSPRQRILLAEDDADLRRLNADALSCLGYQVDSVADGSAALESLQDNSCDLLITDNGKPNMTGVDLLQALHASGNQIPVILITAAVPPLNSAQRLLLKPSRILLEPYTLDELLEIVKNVLHASAVVLGTTPPPPNWAQTQP